MTERQQKFIKGLRYCAKETVTCDTCPFFGSCRSLLAKTALGIINELQAQQPKWIPVTEGLPEAETMNYVTTRTQSGRLRTQTAYYGEQSWEYVGYMTEVIAWMPLPEPYKPKEDNERGREK